MPITLAGHPQQYLKSKKARVILCRVESIESERAPVTLTVTGRACALVPLFLVGS